jgi:glycosyltransferase involved in cell wall biosynthesis
MILLYALIITVLINCVYYFLFSKYSFFNSSESPKSNTFPVSLIVCAKNELDNLEHNIPLWQAQEHPNFEIILINDASTDNSLALMESFAENDPRIKIVNVENNEAFWGNKKYALTLGIKRAKHKRLLFTDADCRPASSIWLQEMASYFSAKKQLILGYGAYEKKSGILNALIRFETLMTALQYFSYAKAGLPYMGVGRNLAYTSDLFYANNGFMSHIKIPSGDDDLFVNEVATGKNTAISDNPKSFTYSLPKHSWNSWFIQKKRHISTSQQYKFKHKLLLGIYYIFNVLFWVLSLTSLLVLDWKTPLILMSIRIILQYVVVGKAATKLKESNLLPFIPFLEIFLVFTQMSIFISNSFSKPTRWK